VLEDLIEIDFGTNKIHGKIPKCLSSLKKLERLSLQENYLEGEIPKDLADLPHLAGIYLSNNNFTGKLTISSFFIIFIRFILVPLIFSCFRFPSSRSLLSENSSADLYCFYMIIEILFCK
jgi:Leucine-rich repeat (LRR) protein